MDENLVPRLVRVAEVRPETADTRTLGLTFEEPALQADFRFVPGQFCLISIMGTGESAFCIASPPAWNEFFEVSVKNVGRVTEAIHDLEVGDRVGFRGPYGNGFPYQEMQGRRVVIVAGGMGLAPVRPLLWQMLGERPKFEDLTLIYGVRRVRDLIYREDLQDWGRRDDVRLVRTVDPGGEDDAWDGEVGLVPEILERIKPPRDSVLVTAGPPVMIKFVILWARKQGFKPSDVITTLEMKMKCGVGLCGRCNIGNRYVCTDGPVFSLEQIQTLPDEF